jgi:hypothetical protein
VPSPLWCPIFKPRNPRLSAQPKSSSLKSATSAFQPVHLSPSPSSDSNLIDLSALKWRGEEKYENEEMKEASGRKKKLKEKARARTVQKKK